MRRLLPDFRDLPRAFWLLWAGGLINRLGTFVQPFLSLYLSSQRGLSIETSGAVVSLVSASDRWRRARRAGTWPIAWAGGRRSAWPLR